MPRHAVALLVVLSLGACRRREVVRPDPIVVDAPDPSAACAASCREGVCGDSCSTIDVPIGPELDWLYTQHVTLAGRHLVWDLAGERLSHHDLCTGKTTRIDCGPEDCVYWYSTPSSLYYTRANDVVSWNDGITLPVANKRTYGRFRLTTDGRLYSDGLWEDRISWPHRSGLYLEGPHGAKPASWITEDASDLFIVDRQYVYYGDGQTIMRIGPDEKPQRIFDAGTGARPAPIATRDGTVFAARGDVEQVTPTPTGPIAIDAIRDGRAECIFSTEKGSSCFAATGSGALFCIESDLLFVDFARKSSRVLFPIEKAWRLGAGGRDHMTKVALSEDGGIAWSLPSDKPRVIRVRRPPKSVDCGS